jgi:hypothetical protein
MTATIHTGGGPFDKYGSEWCDGLEKVNISLRARAEAAEADLATLKNARFDTERATEILACLAQEWFASGGKDDAGLRFEIRRQLERFLNAPDFRLSTKLSDALALDEEPRSEPALSDG